MQHEFSNAISVPIGAGAPSDITSVMEVNGVTGNVQNVSVLVDLDHSFTRDLLIRLRAPDGNRITLVNQEGGSGDHFRGTIFDDRSTSSIRRALPPFNGRFRPDQPLAGLNGAAANGQWTLEVTDNAFQDGGSLNSWTLSFSTDQAPGTKFEIDVRFLGGLSVSQRQVFDAAAQRWSEIIVGELPAFQTDLGLTRGIVIEASAIPIDRGGGPNGNVLGQAGPRVFRPFLEGGLPATGVMQFDSFDLARMENDGSLVNVIIHEMVHCLGHGTAWGRKDLLFGRDTNNPRFTGRNARREFGLLLGTNVPTDVSVANRGGPGTRDGHWRERVFGNELLTGRLNPGVNPISRMSIASLADLGYEVNMDAADAYSLPSSLALAMMGVDGEGSKCCTCHHHH